MPKRITLTLPDELAERLARVADYYDKDVREFILGFMDEQTEALEKYHVELACQQIEWFANVEPQGRA